LEESARHSESKQALAELKKNYEKIEKKLAEITKENEKMLKEKQKMKDRNKELEGQMEVFEKNFSQTDLVQFWQTKFVSLNVNKKKDPIPGGTLPRPKT